MGYAEAIDNDEVIKKLIEIGGKEKQEILWGVAKKMEHDRKTLGRILKKDPLSRMAYAHEFLQMFEIGYVFGFIEGKKEGNEKAEKQRPPKEESSVVKVLKEMAKKGEIKDKKIRKMIEKL